MFKKCAFNKYLDRGEETVQLMYNGNLFREVNKLGFISLDKLQEGDILLCRNLSDLRLLKVKEVIYEEEKGSSYKSSCGFNNSYYTMTISSFLTKEEALEYSEDLINLYKKENEEFSLSVLKHMLGFSLKES